MFSSDLLVDPLVRHAPIFAHYVYEKYAKWHVTLYRLWSHTVLALV